MQKSKKVFLIVAVIFLAIVGAIVADFSRRTTFPGPKTQKDTLEAPKAPAAGDTSASIRR